MSERPRPNAAHSIPDDPENSTYSVGTSSAPGANGGNATNPPGLLLGADYGAYPIPMILTFGVKMDF